MTRSTTQYIYFTRLELENVRAFAERQVLDLTYDDGRPAQWTLIVGDNGVGKTTILQCLAGMRPIYTPPEDRPAGRKRETPKKEGRSKKQGKLEFELARADNSVLEALGRSANTDPVELKATLVVGQRLHDNTKGMSLTARLSFTRKRSEKVEKGWEIDSKPKTQVAVRDKQAIRSEPLVLAYGAGRHMGHWNFDRARNVTATESLFDAAVEFIDAEEVLWQLRFAEMEGRPGASSRLKSLFEVLAAVLPDIPNAQSFKIHGPPSAGSPNARTGVYVQTPYGEVPMDRLSLGYQTFTGLVVDIARRLFEHYHESAEPLLEPAIVIIDEIDLHLHPKWQRQVRGNLTRHFPHVQFVATAHSPLMAQTYLDANLAIVRREEGEDHAVVVSDPKVATGWRLDQIVTSELFALPSAVSPDIEKLFDEHRALAAKSSLNETERRRLAHLRRTLLEIPTETAPEDREAMEIIRRAAAKLK